MSDTPETDKATIASGGDWSPVLRETCRRLERERDQWAAMCGRYKQERDEAITRRMETIMQCELYEQERDEVREVFWEMWQSGDAFLPHVDNETTNRWRKAAGWEETK